MIEGELRGFLSRISAEEAYIQFYGITIGKNGIGAHASVDTQVILEKSLYIFQQPISFLHAHPLSHTRESALLPSGAETGTGEDMSEYW